MLADGYRLLAKILEGDMKWEPTSHGFKATVGAGGRVTYPPAEEIRRLLEDIEQAGKCLKKLEGQINPLKLEVTINPVPDDKTP